jgi:NAD(P)-dependent dehydrogenase (short-subunit alcohol dehydrogenase family)
MDAMKSKTAQSGSQELKGKRAIVTGAAKRIGREVALELARAGVDVAITFRNSDREARKTVVELSALGVRAFALNCDVRDQKSVKTMIAEAKRKLGSIDILVNNAGAYETVPFEKITVEQWDDIFATNARGAFLVSQAAAKELRKNKGRIVNIGSLGGMQPWATHIHYCASKAALHMLTQATAKALAPNVTVNCVAPGMIPMDYTTPKSQLKHFAGKTPMHRNGTANDVAIAVRFLAGTSQFITGQILVVDGGLGLA